MNFSSLRKFSTLFDLAAIPDKRLLERYLKQDPLVLADVGATGGLDKAWGEIEPFCRFMTFDPDPRAEALQESQDIFCFPSGLWSSKASLPLHLTAFPSASSVFPLNQTFLSSFLNAESHKVVGVASIEVDSMENLLKDSPLHPHFLKIDAEGADGEILKGAAKYLATSCYGIKVEVSFTERHQGAPFFSDIDAYLRKFGFSLMRLHTERWIRKNNRFGPTSQPQVIWGDAFYMLSIPTFIDRVKDLPQAKRSLEVIRFLTLLLLYKMHDYAEELRETASQQLSLDPEINQDARKMIQKAIPSGIKLIGSLSLCLMMGSLGQLIPRKHVRHRFKTYTATKWGELLHALHLIAQKRACRTLIRDL